jgi:ketosteroid isomerase-like protein
VAADDVILLREAYSRPSFEEFGRFLHPDAVLHQVPDVPDADSFYGKDEFLRGVRLWMQEWDDFQFVPLEFIDGAAGVAVRIRLKGRGKGSGVEVEEELFHVWEIRDGLAWRCVVHRDEAAARRGAGV